MPKHPLIKKYTKMSNYLFSFSKTLPGEIIKISSIIIIVLLLSWGITRATTDDFEASTKNFSVIGTVSSLSDTTISLMNARGSDTKQEEFYNLNIEHLDKVETKDYQPLIISDIQPGDIIVAQGVTNATTFFIKRIVSFSTKSLPITEETATTTAEVLNATTTEEVSTTTSEISDEQEEGDVSSDISTTSEPEDISTTTIEYVATTTDTTNDTATGTQTVIDTMKDIIEGGLDIASDVLDTIIDTVTGSQEPESVLEVREESVQESPPVE